MNTNILTDFCEHTFFLNLIVEPTGDSLIVTVVTTIEYNF